MKEYICLCNKNEELFTILDNIFIDFIKKYNAEQYHVPALISGDCLKRCGYLDSFPHQLTIPTHVETSKIKSVIEKGSVSIDDIKLEDFYLTPSACLHFYPMLEDQKIENKVLTTLTPVYRYEDKGYNSKTRLWEFTVREVLFVGSKEFVDKMMREMMEKVLDFAQRISKDASIKIANDSFYPNKKNKIKGMVQVKNNLKKELVININKEDVAVASFNYHNSHFSKAYHFDNNGSTVSGCVGFGMERWVAACINEKIMSDDLKKLIYQ